jgi:hypothetical protein
VGGTLAHHQGCTHSTYAVMRTNSCKMPLPTCLTWNVAYNTRRVRASPEAHSACMALFIKRGWDTGMLGRHEDQRWHCWPSFGNLTPFQYFLASCWGRHSGYRPTRNTHDEDPPMSTSTSCFACCHPACICRPPNCSHPADCSQGASTPRWQHTAQQAAATDCNLVLQQQQP